MILIHLDNLMVIFDFGYFQEVNWSQPKTQNLLKQVQLQWIIDIYKWKLQTKIFLIVPML